MRFSIFFALMLVTLVCTMALAKNMNKTMEKSGDKNMEECQGKNMEKSEDKKHSTIKREVSKIKSHLTKRETSAEEAQVNEYPNMASSTTTTSTTTTNTTDVEQPINPTPMSEMSSRDGPVEGQQ